jgi:hypothetical protein
MPLAHSDVTTFVAIIHSISNTTHEPVFFQYADSRVIDSHNVIVYAIIQNLGRNLASNKDTELQFILLNNHLYSGTTYEIAKVKYNSFEFLKERKYTIVKSYGNFTKS